MNRLPSSVRSIASRCLVALLIASSTGSSFGQSPPPSTKLKDQMRQPWTRSNERFIRGPWQISQEISIAANDDGVAFDPFASSGGESTLKPGPGSDKKLANGSALAWRSVTAWGDAIDLSDGKGLKRNLVAYAFTDIKRPTAGKARLCLGSDEGMRAWVNGQLVLDQRGPRPLTFDENQIEVDLKAGDNDLLVKVEQHTDGWAFAARVLESGALPARIQEIAPSFTVDGKTLVVKSDLNSDHASEHEVTVQLVAAGGKVFAEKRVSRGQIARLDTSGAPDGAYEIRATTQTLDGNRYATHLAWYKGDAIAAARELVAAAKTADINTPAGQTIKMLGDMVIDRLGAEGLAITGNPWWIIHSPLMEYAELKLEAGGHKLARARSSGFYRLAWKDDVDGSPQFARAYLPVGYDAAKKTPLIIKLHGYNPANPVYVRWWAADSRHSLADVEYGQHEGVIYLEAHGRGNTMYLSLGDTDIMRCVAEAKAHFNVDEDRVYLCGDSMGGWGTWNVGTRHPDVFAALAPIYGGVDYHASLREEQLATLSPIARLLYERDSTQAFTEGLINMPVLVLHGDVDQAVNVEWSHYNVRMLERWGYNIRYVELPGYGHEDLNRMPLIFDWLLQHRREANPRHVRLRSAELNHASAYWVSVDAFDRVDDFARVDAEVVAPNTIRLDSENVLALTLSPRLPLIDPGKPVKVVWNGKATGASMKVGKVTLLAENFKPSDHAKSPALPGSIGEVYNTPFAIVVGTASTDAAMKQVCREKADALAAMWLEWQRQPARTFTDTEISDADLARYSLILIGGADANLVTRKFADRLPLKVTNDSIALGSHVLPASNARVEMLRPNPLNAQRYVVVIAATSSTGLQFWSPSSLRNDALDFVIEDGRVPNAGQQLNRDDLWVAGGWFDRNWEVQDNLIFAGNADSRAKALTLTGPLDPTVLDGYTGSYALAPGVAVKVIRKENKLFAEPPGQAPVELVPAGKDAFFIFEGPVTLTFTRDTNGKVISLDGTRPNGKFSARRSD